MRDYYNKTSSPIYLFIDSYIQFLYIYIYNSTKNRDSPIVQQLSSV